MGSNGSCWLARIAYSRSACTSSGSARAAPVTSIDASPASSRATCIRLTVSVPVLSLHSTVAAPSASSAGIRRVRTWLFAMRQAPIAWNTVRTTGNSSGSSDIATVSPASTPSSQSWRTTPWMATIVPHRRNAKIARRLTTTATSRSSAVRSTSTSASTLPIRPIAVRPPVAITSKLPWPPTTSVPEKTAGRSSPPGCTSTLGAAPASRARLRTGTDSPVRSDSSIWRFIASARTPSAGTRSPSATATRSPRTTSRPAIRLRTPPRRTSARGLDRSRSASTACSVRRSWTSVMPTTMTTIPSSVSASPGSPRTR